MALNREEKRKLEKSGGVSDEDQPSSRRTTDTKPAAKKEERTSARVFVKEVRAELRKVAWPTRKETMNYSLIVAVTLVLMTVLIFGLDWVFSEAVLRLFNVK